MTIFLHSFVPTIPWFKYMKFIYSSFHIYYYNKIPRLSMSIHSKEPLIQNNQGFTLAESCILYLPMSGGNRIKETSFRQREVRFLSCANPSGSLQEVKQNLLIHVSKTRYNFSSVVSEGHHIYSNKRRPRLRAALE